MKKSIIILSIIFTILFSVMLTNSNQVYATDTTRTTNSATKHSTLEVITYVTSSIYNPLTNNYINSCVNENDEIYKYYSDQNLYSSWQVLIIDTKGNTDFSDDEVINSYNLINY